MRVVVSIVIVLVVVGSTLWMLPATAQDISLRDLLPAAEAIGADFVVIDDRARTLAEQADAFANASDAARRLAEWGWQENAFLVFQATTPTATGAPSATLDISLTRFATADGASQALVYFLDDRATVLGQQEAPVTAPLGDEARAVSGEVETGFDTTLYVRSGPLLVRISATTASGAPAAAPEQLARGIIDRANGLWQPVAAIGSLAASLPESLLSFDSTCSRVGGEDELAMPAAMERFDGIPDAAASLAAMGWEAGVSRQFGCDSRQPGQIGWVNVGVHRFRDAEAAAEAVHVFAKSRGFVAGLRSEPPPALGDGTAAIAGPAVNGAEYSLYLSDGPLLFRITGVAPAGDPRADVTRIAAALLDPIATPRDVLPTPTSTPWVAPTATATPPPAPVAIVPTIAPLPTATAIPTAIPLPTATAVPTLAPPPPPTATPLPRPTSTPYSLPTATTGAVPTPTPRVIHLPTPEGGD